MRLLTFQDKLVAESLISLKEQGKKAIYQQDKIFYQKREEVLYKKFIEMMKEQLNIDRDRKVIPIWCWVIPKKQELTEDYIDSLISRFTPKCDRLTYLELEVPDTIVFVTNFDVWYDLLFKCTFYNVEPSDEDIKNLIKKVKGATLQASIPFIYAEFIKSYKDYNDFGSRDYSLTDMEVKKLQSKGKFLEG